MKNFTVFVCLFMAIGSSQEVLAQFNQGRWLAGGSMSLTRRSTSTTAVNLGEIKATTTAFSLGPQAGYFVMDYLAVGAVLNFSASGSNGTTYDPGPGTLVDMTSRSSSISIGPFIRYYLPASVFFQAKVDFGTGKNSYHGGTISNEGTSKEFHYGGAVGYAYFLNDYVAIEPTVGYQSYGTNYNNSNNRSGYWYLNAGFTIYLGERK